MKTSELIDLLVNDLRPLPPLVHVLVFGAVCGALIAGIAFASMLGVRADIGIAQNSARFLYKLLVTLALVAASAVLLGKVGKPGMEIGPYKWFLLLPLTLILAGALVEMVITASDAWVSRSIGSNGLKCLTIIPLLSLAPLGCLIHGLRLGAPDNPGMAGAIAGLTAAGISATFYALNCDDDSPLFVLLWYVPAIALVALIGYVSGIRLLRW